MVEKQGIQNTNLSLYCCVAEVILEYFSNGRFVREKPPEKNPKQIDQYSSKMIDYNDTLY